MESGEGAKLPTRVLYITNTSIVPCAIDLCDTGTTITILNAEQGLAVRVDNISFYVCHLVHLSFQLRVKMWK